MYVTNYETRTEKAKVWLTEQLKRYRNGEPNTEIQQMAKDDPTLSYLLEEIDAKNRDPILLQTLLHIVEEYDKAFNLTEQQSVLWGTIVAKWAAVARRTEGLTSKERREFCRAKNRLSEEYSYDRESRAPKFARSNKRVMNLDLGTPDSTRSGYGALLAAWFRITLREAQGEVFFKDMLKLASSLPTHVQDIAVLDFWYQSRIDTHMGSSTYYHIQNWVTIFENSFWSASKFCDFPTTLCLDDEGKYHNSNGPAIAWADGTEFYYHHGVRVKYLAYYDKKLDYLPPDRDSKNQIKRVYNG